MRTYASFVTIAILAATPAFAQYGFDFTVVEDTVQSGTSLITWHFVLTNTGSVPDTYALDLRVIQNNAGWFIQHCAGGVCTEPGNILTVDLDPGASDPLIDVQVFIDSGPDTAILNYLAYSTGDTVQRDSFNLYAISELSVEEQDDFALENFSVTVSPNPFTNTTVIRCEMRDGSDDKLSMKILDVTGRVVRSLSSLPHAPRPVQIRWDGTDANGIAVPPGVYIVCTEYPSCAAQTSVIKLQ